MDETYVKVAGEWKYLYRAVDRDGDTVDLLLTGKRDMAAAWRFFGACDRSSRRSGKNHHRQKRREHSGNRKSSGGFRLRYPTAPDQIPEQHRRTRSSRRQTNRSSDVGIQSISLRAHHSGWNRDHAHDQESAARLSRRSSLVRSIPILFSRILTKSQLSNFDCRRFLNATEPESLRLAQCGNGRQVADGR